jgi:hypothetical protein
MKKRDEPADPSSCPALAVLLALEAGELSSGQACALLGVDPLAVRVMRAAAVVEARRAWGAWRAANPAAKE